MAIKRLRAEGIANRHRHSGVGFKQTMDCRIAIEDHDRQTVDFPEAIPPVNTATRMG